VDERSQASAPQRNVRLFLCMDGAQLRGARRRHAIRQLTPRACLSGRVSGPSAFEAGFTFLGHSEPPTSTPPSRLRPAFAACLRYAAAAASARYGAPRNFRALAAKRFSAGRFSSIRPRPRANTPGMRQGHTSFRAQHASSLPEQAEDGAPGAWAPVSANSGRAPPFSHDL